MTTTHDNCEPTGEGITGQYPTLDQLCSDLEEYTSRLMSDVRDDIKDGRFDLVTEDDYFRVRDSIEFISEVLEMLASKTQRSQMLDPETYCPCCCRLLPAQGVGDAE